ncbi:hypothetical protein OPT61_g9280 [Boeremia exigua]|uniref:Uncharacterized protein n=1 Tax=Boeremia exigua TaxID=749465 RepID=A0ACC2HUR9_9PLEO|nr:hypothetical protein OPT61_g9280 [Boeremia exigua]
MACVITPPSESEVSPSRDLIYSTIDGSSASLREVNQKRWLTSLEIHNNPELCYKEYVSCETLVLFLSRLGFAVTDGAFGLETSFIAEFGKEGRLVTFCAEYDALPDIGHACGHNLIATASVAAFLGVAEALKTSKIAGRVRLLGCPAEEGGGGKIKLIKAGAFKETDAAMMVHPVQPLPGGKDGVAYGTCLAATAFEANFLGKASHAGVLPWLGVNALDAASLAYTAIGLLRQQCRPTDRINVVLDRENRTGCGVITDKASLSFGVRCASLNEVRALEKRVKNCVEGAALATGCSFEYTKEMEAYADLRPNETLCVEFTQAMRHLGSELICDLARKDVKGYGTDMGNVSYECPSLHAVYNIPAGPGQEAHSIGFAQAAGKDDAFLATLRAAKGLALLGFTVLENSTVAAQVWKDFNKDLEKR